jgi:hypothetical protein
MKSSNMADYRIRGKEVAGCCKNCGLYFSWVCEIDGEYHQFCTTHCWEDWLKKHTPEPPVYCGKIWPIVIDENMEEQEEAFS